jgi:hypothetical protein
MWAGADYEIDDPRPIAASAPYTFFLPSGVDTAAIRPGDLIKATIRAIPPSPEWDAERLWFTVTAAFDESVEGRLESEPSDMPRFPAGRTIEIPRAAIIDLIFADERPRTEGPKEYWDRCLVDSAALKGLRPVEYVYREEPETRADDRFPDSGWRVRASIVDPEASEVEDEGVEYVALGAVLNKDDSWIDLLDAPVGSAFLRDFDTNTWAEAKE